jgi:histidine ammonia-lyase
MTTDNAVTTATVVQVGVGPLTEAEVVAVARGQAEVRLTAESISAITEARSVIESLASDIEPHYGISTGFGALATKHIPVERRAQLQRSLIRSHAAGSGPNVRSCGP